MKRYFKAIIVTMVLAGVLFSCSKKENVQEASGKHFSYMYNNGTDSVMVEVTKTPQKAALYSHFITEMLLALDLGDRIIIGTSEGDFLPEYQKAYEKIPTKLVGHHNIFSKEEFLLSGVDFASGWDDAIRPETTGTATELLAKGIYPYTVKSIRDGETLETLYEDFQTLGKIFKVEDKANALVEKMKTKLAEAEKSFVKKSDAEKKKVMVFSHINNGLYISSGFTTDLINRAGGKNVYDDVLADHEMVSYESLVHRNPDIILIAHLGGGMPFEEKVKFLKNHPALKDLPAVKNNNIHNIALEDIAPGVRNIDFIIKLNKLMYER